MILEKENVEKSNYVETQIDESLVQWFKYNKYTKLN